MGSGTAELYDKQKNLIAIGHKAKGMYFSSEKHSIESMPMWLKRPPKAGRGDWHRKFGHIGVSRLQCTKKGGLVDGFEMPKDKSIFDCTACMKVKQTQNPFPRQTVTHTTKPGELTHTDLWEVCKMGIHRVRCFIFFIVNCSWCIIIKRLKTQDQAAEKVKNYVTYLECQYDMKPKQFHANNGGEYIGTTLKQWCEQKGVKLEYIAPHSPEKNGVTECMNRTLAEFTHVMILGHQLLSTYGPRSWDILHIWEMDHLPGHSKAKHL